MIDIVRITDIMKSNQRKEDNMMADLKVIKKVGNVDGQPWEAYYLVFQDNGINVELKLRANPTEKQHLEVLVNQSIKK